MRKLATALAVSIALSSGSANALSLGEIEMRSALNQPMSAEIRLSSVRADEMRGMIVKLASPEAFARAGIERTDALMDLRFSVNQDTQAIVITSRRPVVEPFLNFLLEVDWQSGRMVREYTVLLDPPVFMSPNTSARADTASDQPVLVQRDDTSLVTPSPIQRESDIGAEGEIISLDSLGGEAASLNSNGGEEVSLEGEVINLDGELVSVDSLDTAGGEDVSFVEINVDEIEVATFDANSGTAVNVEEDSAIARARAAGAAARAAVNSGTLVADTSAITLDTISGGEIITLDEIGADGGEVISLTDLGAPNIDAQVEYNANQLPEVELIGDGGEAGSVSSSATVASTGGDSVVVQRGDTLGTIAERAAGNGVSTQQMMMALLAANESAFINGNINLVKAGASLRVPTADEAAQISQAQALAGIGEQNRLWQEYRDGVRSGQRATQVAQAAQSPRASANANVSVEENSGLTSEAARILESAREEVSRRDELSIVADNDASTTTASATADESTASDANRLGEINRKLQLAKEELASSRRESSDLGEQTDQLQSTGDNLDTLVNLQQNDIAKLEAQLEAAKQETEQASADSSNALADAADNANDAASSAADSVASATDGATDALADAADGASEAAANLAGSAGNLVGGAADQAGDAVNGVVAGAGDAVDGVELVTGDAAEGAAGALSNATDAAANAGDAATAAAEAPKGWMENIMGSNLKWPVIGTLGVAGAGLLGVLFMGRRKRKAIDDEALDDVEFLDEMDAADDGSVSSDVVNSVQDGAAGAADSAKAGVGAVAAAGGAGVAAAAAAVGMGGKDDDEIEPYSESMDATAVDDDLTGAAAELDSDADDLDHDDTISNVDVYLAYGLHGQAEELLTKAIDKDDSNPEYYEKLAETYALQNNAEGHSQVTEQFKAKFGESHPSWAGIAAKGHEIDPGNALYAGAAGAVAAVGVGKHDEAPALDNDDFLSDASSDVESISRGFDNEGSAEAATDLPNLSSSDAVAGAVDDADETHLMDQSIDPAFAFDEADLEATGDFSQIAEEIRADGGDDTSSLDFPGFDSMADSATDAVGDTAGNITDAASGIAGTVGDKASEAMNDMNLDVPGMEKPGLDDAPSLDAIGEDSSSIAAAAEDLTLDLNQLSGDIELDSTEILDDSLDAGESLNFDSTSDETLLAGTDSLDVDEMETMMDLAKAFIDMGDNDSASSTLDEIVKSGNPSQVSEAETLKRKIS